jgi:hypothetical protein
MAAGLGFKTFTTGEVLTSADVNGYLMQGVLVFASEAARDAAITSPQEGQFAFTKDNNSLWYYDSAAWVASGATGDIEGVTAGTGISGGGTSGTVTITNSMATEIDAKGDLVVGTGADTFARLAVGANGTVLTAASGEATGLEWAAPASGGGMTLLSTTSVSSLSTVTISSISGSYTNLQVWIEGANFSDGDNWIRLAPNASTTLSNFVQAVGTIPGTNFLQDGRNGYYPIGKSTSMGDSDANSAFILNFFNYAGSQAVKIITENAYYKNNQGSYGMTMVTGSFVSSSAISSLVFSVPTGTYSATIKVYGVK